MPTALVQAPSQTYHNSFSSPSTATNWFNVLDTTPGNLILCKVGAVSSGTTSGNCPLPSLSAPTTPGFVWTLVPGSVVTNAIPQQDPHSGYFTTSVMAVYYIVNAPLMHKNTDVTSVTATTLTNPGQSLMATCRLSEWSGVPASATPASQVITNIGAGDTPDAGSISITNAGDLLIVCALDNTNFSQNIIKNAAFTRLTSGGLPCPFVEYIANAPVGSYATVMSGAEGGFGGADVWQVVGIVFSSLPTPPPPPPCSPVGVNGVYVTDLSLFIGPATALYATPVPTASIAVNESSTQGRNALILDFNNSEGLYARDLGVVFSWPISSKTVLDLWQPSIIPLDNDVYQRLSFHFLMKSLGGVGWQHIRELSLAYNSTAPLNLLLTFDQWPAINLTIPSSNGNEIKSKIVLPPNKFQLVEGFLSCSVPFLLWASDCELKIGNWGRTDGYRNLKPFSG